MSGNNLAWSDEKMLLWLNENVRVNERGCRIWAGKPGREGGSPRVSWNGKNHSARRLLWVLSGRPITDDQIVFERKGCGERACMNIDHLMVGTMSQRKRQDDWGYGSKRRSLVLLLSRGKTARLPVTERANVDAMRADGLTLKEIGDHYGVSEYRAKKAIDNWNRILGVRLAA